MFFNKKVYVRETAIFGETSQNCDYASIMIIEWNRNKITYYFNNSVNEAPRIEREKYWTVKKAYQKYHEAIGRAVCGGWSLRELKNGDKTLFTFQYKAGTKGNWKGLE